MESSAQNSSMCPCLRPSSKLPSTASFPSHALDGTHLFHLFPCGLAWPHPYPCKRTVLCPFLLPEDSPLFVESPCVTGAVLFIPYIHPVPSCCPNVTILTPKFTVHSKVREGIPRSPKQSQHGEPEWTQSQGEGWSQGHTVGRGPWGQASGELGGAAAQSWGL